MREICCDVEASSSSSSFQFAAPIQVISSSEFLIFSVDDVSKFILLIAISCENVELVRLEVAVFG